MNAQLTTTDGNTAANAWWPTSDWPYYPAQTGIPFIYPTYYLSSPQPQTECSDEVHVFHCPHCQKCRCGKATLKAGAK